MLPIIVALLLLFVLFGVAVAWLAYQSGRQRASLAAQELATLNEFGRELLRSRLSVDDLAEQVFQQAQQLVPTNLFQLGLFDGDAYHVKVWIRDDEHLPTTVFPDGGTRGIVGWIRESGQPLLIQDYAAERDTLPAFPDFDLDAPPSSGLFVPLIAGTATIGVIAVQSYQVGRFKDSHLRLLTTLGNQAASALRHAQLYEQAQRRAEQLNLIGNVSNRLSAIQPLPDLFRQIVTLTQETFGYYCVSIFTLEQEHLVVRASTNPRFMDTGDLDPGQGMIGWAASKGLVALANNVASDPRYRKLGVLPETRSEVSLPLKIEDRVLGVLDVQSDVLGAFSDEDVSLLETLASQLALAIEQAETYDTERQLARRLEALVQVSQTLVSVLDLDDLLERVVELIADTFGFERVHIFVKVGEMLVFRAGTGVHSFRWLVEELAYEEDDPGLIPKVARTGVPELVPDVTAAPEYRPGAGVEDTRSEMSVPIQMAGRIMGVLDVQSVNEAAFTQADLILVQSLADSVAVAIRNAALYANERRRRNLADALREVSATLASELDADRVLSGVLEGLRRVVSLDKAAILLFDEAINTLTVYATSGPGLEGFVGHRRQLDDLVADEAALENHIHALYRELLGIPDERPTIAVPLVVGGELIGFVVADRTYEWLQASTDYEMVGAFANQAAIAISNARLYAAQQAETYVTTVLLQVAEAANAQADLTAALDTIARLTALLAGVSRCLILRWDAGERTYSLVSQYGIPRERSARQSGKPIPASEHPLLEVLSVASIPLHAGKGQDLPLPEPLMGFLPDASVMCLPLRAKGEAVGLLVVDYPEKGENPRLLSILQGIAHQTATVLETAALQAIAVERERLEQELQVARTIQASFIPDSPPQVPGWQVSAIWRAARQVSGDFYDFIQLPDGCWGMVMADVADKGMPAALFMAVCRTLVRAAAVSRTSPAQTLSRVNALLFNDSRADLFVTVFYAIWNPSTGEVKYASAGHNPGLLVRGGSGEVIELRSRGLALGVIPQVELEEHSMSLEPGDALVSYTDGVTEAMQSDYTEWGLGRFKAALRSSGGLHSEAMLHLVLESIDDFVGGAPQSDDLTMWVLRRE